MKQSLLKVLSSEAGDDGGKFNKFEAGYGITFQNHSRRPHFEEGFSKNLQN
jgi:hypothetical protein